MAKDGLPEGLKTALMWVLGIGIIALTLLILVILFGNLQGNTGFTQDSTAFSNETITLSDTGAIPGNASSRVNPSLSNVVVTNETSGEIITTANYSLTGVTFRNITGDYGGIGVNVSATVTYDSQGQVDSDGIITNYTASAVNVSAQFPTVGTIIGVALLLIILIGVLIFAIKKMMGVANVTGTSGSFERGSDGGFG